MIYRTKCNQLFWFFLAVTLFLIPGGIAFGQAPTFISLTPNNFTSSVGVPVEFSLTMGDGDGYQDLSDIRLEIRQMAGTGSVSDSIVLWYTRSKPDRIYMWNHTENRWRWVVLGSAVILENTYCSLDASRCSYTGSGDIAILNFSITPKPVFIAAPLTGDKRIVLQLKDTASHTLRDTVIGSWNVTP